MPFVLIVFGILALTVGIRGKQQDFFTLMRGDFTGPNNFLYWLVAILAVGSIGYIKKAQPLSDAFLVLIVIVMFLKNQGFFDQFMAQIQATTTKQFDVGPITQSNPIGLGLGGLFDGHGASGNW